MGEAFRASRRFVLGPWPIHAWALWALLSATTLAFTWRFFGPNPLVPQTDEYSRRLLMLLVIGLASPAAFLVPLIIYRNIRSRSLRTPIRSAEYLLVLAAASLLAAVILPSIFRDEPVYAQFQGEIGLLPTVIRFFVVIWFVNAVLGTVFSRIQRESNSAKEYLQTVEKQRRLLLDSEERVRGQVAEYLHDRVQTDLLSVGLRIRSAVASGSEEMVRNVDEALVELERVRSDEIRGASRRLSPNLTNVTLHSALRELADAYRPGMKIKIDVSDAAAARLKGLGDLTRATGIYRICEQGLMNAAMHGHANECSIALFINDAGSYVLELHDNGVGLSASPIEPGRGSSLISAWVDSLNGRWSLGPATVGTRLTAIVPAA
jgi:signal transduction histidine kinase